MIFKLSIAVVFAVMFSNQQQSTALDSSANLARVPSTIGEKSTENPVMLAKGKIRKEKNRKIRRSNRIPIKLLFKGNKKRGLPKSKKQEWRNPPKVKHRRARLLPTPEFCGYNELSIPMPGWWCITTYADGRISSVFKRCANPPFVNAPICIWPYEPSPVR